MVDTPPKVSIPNDNGVTSKRTKSLISPANTPPWIAAPIDTHSIGSIPRSIVLPMNFSTYFCTIGILVGPPTRMILSMSDLLILASSNACCIGFPDFLTMSSTNSSNLALVRLTIKFLGDPSLPIVMNGKFTSVVKVVDNSIFAFSAASLNLCTA